MISTYILVTGSRENHMDVDGVNTTRRANGTNNRGQGTLAYPAPFDQPFYIILNLAVGGSWVKSKR